MTLILGNEEIEQVLEMPECISVLEEAYRLHERLEAINRPRTDLYTPHEIPNAFYVFKTFEGMVPQSGVVALRLCSDVIRWTDYAGGVRKEKLPHADGDWVGLVLLFSTHTGEPLAILQDGVMGRTRVGVANALAARYMARADSKVYGLLGAGWQAGAQLMAMAAVRDLKEIRVFSPNPVSRARFAEEYRDKLGLNIQSVDSAEEAAREADIVGAATNAIKPLIRTEWLTPGQHLTCIKRTEIGDKVLSKCDRVVLHTRESRPFNYLTGLGDVAVRAHDPVEIALRVRSGELVDQAEIDALNSNGTAGINDSDLSGLIAGKVDGRQDDAEINAFDNNIGLGIQFTVLAELAYRRARERGLGNEIPTKWLTESVHN